MSQRRRRRSILALVLTVAALLAPASALAAPPVDLLPDLRILRPMDFHLQTNANGKHLLRFTAIVTNPGQGPFIARGRKTCSDCSQLSLEQVVRRSDGTSRRVPTDAKQRFSNGDGHHHWHVIGFESYQLFRLDKAFPNGERLGHKSGFCFFDGLPRALELPGAPSSPRYYYGDCYGNDLAQPTQSTKTHVGLSVGWGDIYPWDFGGQYIDITGIPKGQYLTCLTADPSDDFLETNDTNNQAWAKVTIKASSVTVDKTGRTACQSQLPYPVTAGADLPEGVPIPVAADSLVLLCPIRPESSSPESSSPES